MASRACHVSLRSSSRASRPRVQPRRRHGAGEGARAASYQKPATACPRLPDFRLRPVSRHSLPARPARCGATRSCVRDHVFHLGWLYEDPVTIHEVRAAGVREIRFDPRRSTTARTRSSATSCEASGSPVSRALPMNTPAYRDEVLVFSAPVTRVLGRGQRTDSRRVVSRSTPRRPAARSFRGSWSSGSSGRRRRRSS